MASTILYDGPNSGFQVGQNHGHITAQFLQSETSLNQACLRDLRTTNPHDDKDRIKNVNGGLLKDSYCWILDNKEFKQWKDDPSNHLLWIRGDPGKGKTMLLCGIIEELTRSIGNTTNISFFFCQATDVRINTATAVLRGLICSLVEKQPPLLSHVRSRYDQAGKALFEDINAWNALSKIFTDILKDPILHDTYLMIDALDECTADLTFLLDLVIHESPIYPHVKWIVSSRNWPDIEERLGSATQAVPISLELNELSVSEAVNIFIRHKVHRLAKIKHYRDETRDTILSHMTSNSQGTFLWVALVCQELLRTPRWHASEKVEAFPAGLNALYTRMIHQVRNSEDVEICKQILGVMSIVYRPIALDELASFIELPNGLSGDYEALAAIIEICGSFLTLREDTIQFVHQSARDFLLREAQTEILPGGKGAQHYAIYLRSVQAMSKTLRRDIFNLKFPGFPIEKVTQPCPNLLAATRYACVYWVDHLQESRHSERGDTGFVGEWVDIFLQYKYLHWLEALSILRSVSQGITALLKLDDLLQKRCEIPGLLHRVRDATRFARYYRLAIESSPLQVYSSSIVFSPTQSLTKICYQKERPDWVLKEPIVGEYWSSCLQTLEGHSSAVPCIAWSHDATRLASASYDNTARVWDSATGQCVSILEGHNDSVNLVAWSPDGSRLASASRDKTAIVWDPATGQCASTLKGHGGSVNSIAWSPDGSRLASASDDSTIKIWNTATGQCALTLVGHIQSINSVTWSQCGSRLASASRDKSAKVWDPATGRCTSTLKGHSGSVNSIVWSPDGSQLASASFDSTVKIWNPVTGQFVSTLEGHSRWVTSIAWSHDGSRLASASDDSTVMVWDPATGQCASTLMGHIYAANSISWSPDGSRLASASSDSTIKIWSPTTGQCTLTLEGHSQSINSIVWSKDGCRLASGSRDRTVRIWDPAINQHASTLEGHSCSVNSIAWSPDGSRLASAADDSTVRVWDPATGRCTSTLKGHSGSVNSIVWSPDGCQLASASFDSTVKIWNPVTGQFVSTLEGHSRWVTSIAWSHDGSRLASASGDSTVRVWDPATGQCASTFKGHSDTVGSIAWSPDGSRLASASFDSTVKTLDLGTSQYVSTLEGVTGWANSIVWSHDGSRLAVALRDKTVKVWDPATGQTVSILEGHNELVFLIAWSPDGSRLASGSADHTVKIWDLATGHCASTFSISSPGFLQFDKTNLSHLHTSLGIFNIASTGSATTTPPILPSVPEQYGYGLNYDYSWITCDGVNLLWLPAEYRPAHPSLFAISAMTLAIGCSSGRVVFLSLLEHNPTSGF